MCSCFGTLALTPVSDYYVFRVSHQAKHILVSGYSQNVMHVPSMTSCITLNFCLFLFFVLIFIFYFFMLHPLYVAVRVKEQVKRQVYSLCRTSLQVRIL